MSWDRRASASVWTLTGEELARVERVMLSRQGATRPFNAREHYAPPDERRLDYERGSTAAELVVSIALELPWTAEHGPRGCWDVGVGIEVKWSEHDHGHLIVQRATYRRDATAYVLVTGRLPRLTCRGWIAGDQVPRLGRLEHRPEPQRWIGQGELRAMGELNHLVSPPAPPGWPRAAAPVAA